MYDELIEKITKLLPTTIDKDDDGKFVKEAEQGTEERIMNAEYELNILISKHNVAIGDEPSVCIAYYGEDDEWVHLDLFVTKNTTDDEIIAAFSNEFGWIENFE